MLRVVGIERSAQPEREFVLLQNQGHMRVCLRGHLLLSESALAGDPLDRSAHAFVEEEMIPPGLFVLLTTGKGHPHWARTKDGAHVFQVYMQREESLWFDCANPIHVLSTQHSYVERSHRVEFLAVR